VKRIFPSIVIVLAVTALGGCSTSPTASFYTLGAVGGTQKDTYSGSPISVIVGPVTVPDLVDRPQFVIRVSANQVKLDEFARWADPVKTQIPRVIAADLASSLQGSRVSVYSQGDDPASVYRVRVEIQRFDGAPGDAATIEALWSVSPPKSRASLIGRTIVREPCAGPGYDALAAAYSTALAAVSREIAVAIQASVSQ
jgi:uncharacterized lipoprotein YmbA